jgi:cytochrome P450
MTATENAASLQYDPYSEEIGYNPHPLFRRIRDEAPLFYNEEHEFYALSRFEDIERAHIDRETFISSRGVTLDLLKAGVVFPPGTLIFEDPPTHTIHRSLLSRMFTPRKVSGLEPEIRAMTAELLDPLVGTGHFDFAADLGAIMPTRVVGMLTAFQTTRASRCATTSTHSAATSQTPGTTCSAARSSPSTSIGAPTTLRTT